MNQIRTLFFGLLAIMLLLGACKRDQFELDRLKETTWEPDVTGPLFRASLTLEDLIGKSGMVQVDEDKFCTVIYSSHLYSVQASDVLVIKDQYHNERLAFTQNDVDQFNSMQQHHKDYPVNFPFEFEENATVDSLRLKSGRLQITLTSTVQHKAAADILLKNVYFSGQPLNVFADISYQQSLPVVFDTIIDLANTTIGLHDLLGSKVVEANIRVDMDHTGNDFDTDDHVIAEIRLLDADFQYAFGYAGQQEVESGLEEVAINLFNNTTGLGTFSLREPELKFTLLNSFGLPLSVQFTHLETQAPLGASTMISGPAVSSPLMINSPGMSDIGQQMPTTVLFTKDNSNLFQAIEKQPNRLRYQAKVKANPNGRTGSNYILDTSRVDLSVEAKMPMYGKAKNFVLEDTLAFDIENVEEIQHVKFKVHLENGFPFDLGMQIYFLDEQNMVLDSLFDNQRVAPGATVDANGRVTEATPNLVVADFSEERLKGLLETSKMLLKASASTTNGGAEDVKIYADYQFGIEMGVSAGLRVKL